LKVLLPLPRPPAALRPFGCRSSPFPVKFCQEGTYQAQWGGPPENPRTAPFADIFVSCFTNGVFSSPNSAPPWGLHISVSDLKFLRLTWFTPVPFQPNPCLSPFSTGPPPSLFSWPSSRRGGFFSPTAYVPGRRFHFGSCCGLVCFFPSDYMQLLFSILRGRCLASLLDPSHLVLDFYQKWCGPSSALDETSCLRDEALSLPFPPPVQFSLPLSGA